MPGKIIGVIIIPDISEEDVTPILDRDSEDRLLQEELEEAGVTREPIPEYFVSRSTWPKSTNLLCSSCTLPIPKDPTFIPEIALVRTVPTALTQQEDIFRYINDVGKSTYHSASTKNVIVFKRSEDGIVFCDAFCRQRYVARVKDDRIPDPEITLAKIAKFIEMENGDGLKVLSVDEAEDPKMMNQYTGMGITPKQYRELNKNKKIRYSQ